MSAYAPPSKKSSARDYAVAVGLVMAAGAVRLALSPVLGTRAPWVYFSAALAVSGWRFGPRATAVALALSATFGWVFFVGVPGSLAAKDIVDVYVLLSYLVSGAVMVGFSASNQRTRRKLLDESADRERTSRELVESLESFRVLFDHAQSDGVILTNADAVIVAWNRGAESIFGYSADEAVGRTVDFVFTPEDRAAKVPTGERETVAAQGSIANVRWYLRKDGTRFWGDGSTIALHEAKDGIRGYLKVVRDETARHELQEAMRTHSESLEAQVRERTADLRAANAELEGFTYSVSHDMRAPLRAIVGHARILVEDYGDSLPDDARERIDRMSKASSRMGYLIEDLLTYARLNKQEIQKRSIDLAPLFREVIAQESGEVSIDAYAPESLPVMAEPGLMRMVLENLVGNAVKYRRPGVPLKLKFMLLDHHGMCGYAVRDNGIGFEMRYAPKLFEPFERLHRIDEVEGTGIGLANVRRIVERHGGTVWAEGEPGVGSTFGFTLP